MEYINESYNEQEILDLIDFVVPNLTVKESKLVFKRSKKKDNNLYFVDDNDLRYFQYNIITNELGFYHEMLEDVLKYMPGTKIIFFKLIRQWFSNKYDLSVKGIPFQLQKSFIT
jgi:uncharacterized protein (DUF1499 family)